MKKPKTYEEAMTQLQQILDALSDQSTPLEQSLKLYAQAAELVRLCNEKLQAASLQIRQIDDAVQNSMQQPAGAAE